MRFPMQERFVWDASETGTELLYAGRLMARLQPIFLFPLLTSHPDINLKTTEYVAALED